MKLNWTRLELYRSFQDNEKVNEATTESPITEIDADAVVAAEQSGKTDDDPGKKSSIKVKLTIIQRSMPSIIY